MPSPTYKMIPPDGFHPKIANVVMLLRVSRQRITDTVRGLPIEKLDYELDERSTTIGTLLKHIVAVEDWYRLITFERRNFSKKELSFWEGALPGPGQMLDRVICGRPFEYYDRLWRRVRKKTLNQFQMLDDSWLYQTPGNSDYNNYFCWYHVIEDHLCHMGQIKSILNRINNI